MFILTSDLTYALRPLIVKYGRSTSTPLTFSMLCKLKPVSRNILQVVFDNIEDYSAQGAGNAWVAIGGPSAPATRQEESVAARFQEPSAMIARSVETPPQPGAVSGSQPALNRTASPLPAATPQFTLSRDDELPDSTNPFESPSIAEYVLYNSPNLISR